MSGGGGGRLTGAMGGGGGGGDSRLAPGRCLNWSFRRLPRPGEARRRAGARYF